MNKNMGAKSGKLIDFYIHIGMGKTGTSAHSVFSGI